MTTGTGPHVTAVAVPDGSVLWELLPRAEHGDAFAALLAPDAPHDADFWADRIFDDPPMPLRAVVHARDRLMGLGGHKPVVGAAEHDDGRAVGPFQLIARHADEVVFGIDDTHLDFRSSVLVDGSPDARRLVVATVVRCNGLLGRAYFQGVRVAHPLLVRTLLRRAVTRYGNGPVPGPTTAAQR